MNNFALGRAKEVEDGIYGLIKLKKRHKVQSILLYDDYDSLFQLFLKHNPEKVPPIRQRQFFSAVLYCPSVKQTTSPSSTESSSFLTLQTHIS